MRVFAVLLAAGAGIRAGLGLPKQLAKIGGREIILRSLDIFINSDINFEKIIVTIPPKDVLDFDWTGFFEAAYKKNVLKKFKVIAGGKHRQGSVYAALKFIGDNFVNKTSKGAVSGGLNNIHKPGREVDPLKISKKGVNEPATDNGITVFIHDSARPFVYDFELKALLKQAVLHGSSFLCKPAAETIKRVLNRSFANEKMDGNISLNLETLKREELVVSKTPQVFKFGIIKKAMDDAFMSGFVFTDDISLLEMAGYPAGIVQSSEFNIKITSALDVKIAGFLLEEFKKGNESN